MNMKSLAALSVLCFAAAAGAFAPPQGRPPRRAAALAMATPLDHFFALLKGGKVGLVKSLAGEYDAAAVRAKIDGLVEDTPVLMLSFTT